VARPLGRCEACLEAISLGELRLEVMGQPGAREHPDGA
jgi:hypothetical protein